MPVFQQVLDLHGDFSFSLSPLWKEHQGKRSSERRVAFLLVVTNDRSRLAAPPMKILFPDKERLETIFLGKKRCELHLSLTALV